MFERFSNAILALVLAASISFPLASAESTPSVVPLIGSACDKPETETKLNFADSELVTNTLHLEGGELRYKGIGTVGSESIDLRVTVASGDYQNITTAWQARRFHPDNPPNGYSPKSDQNFGRINQMTSNEAPNLGKNTFRFCLLETGTDSPVAAKSFIFAVWDVDHRGGGFRERVIVDTSQVQQISLFPNFDQSLAKPKCQDGTPVVPNLCSGGSVVFESSQDSRGGNPMELEGVNDDQRSRAISMLLEDTDCWEVSFDWYCVAFEPDYGGYASSCGVADRSGFAGANINFSGESDAFFNSPKCFTEAPSGVPSTSPSASPSASTSPSASPSARPSTTPSASPTTKSQKKRNKGGLTTKATKKSKKKEKASAETEIVV